MVLDAMNYFVIQTYCSHCCEYNGLAEEGGRRRRCTQNIQTHTDILTQTHTTHTHTCTQDCVFLSLRGMCVYMIVHIIIDYQTTIIPRQK